MEKCYEVTCEFTSLGYCLVSAENEEQAKEKVLKGDYDDMFNDEMLKVTKVNEIKEADF